MIENKLEKAMKPIPVPYEEFESFPKHVEEFFDLIARRPYELLQKTPLLFGREFEHLWKTEPELLRPIFLKLYETEENLVVRAEVPGFTEKELNIACEPWRLVITGKKEYREEARTEKKEEMPPAHGEAEHLQDHQVPGRSEAGEREGYPQERHTGSHFAQSRSHPESEN